MAVTIEKAQVALPSDREVKVTRSFKAPRSLVYRAFTDPELTRRWMVGFPGWSMPVCEMDVRVGGAYRWRWRNDTDGKEFGFFGTFLEVEPPSRLVHTERYDPGTLGEGYPSDAEARITTTFTEEGGITTMTTVMEYASREARDAAMQTGMTDGMESSYQSLDRVLEEVGRQTA